MIYIAYDWPRECIALANWVFYPWSFINMHGKQEWGIRLLGLVVSNWDEDD